VSAASISLSAENTELPGLATISKVARPQGYVSAIDSNGRTIWIADAHRDDGKRFVVHTEEKLTAFLELESAIRAAERPEGCGGREIKLDELSRTL